MQKRTVRVGAARIDILIMLALLCASAHAPADESPNAAVDRSNASSEALEFAPRARLVPEHELTSGGALFALDLQHGSGGDLLRVARTWVGAFAADGHFGPGWSDGNVITLVSVTPDLFVVRRGVDDWLAIDRFGEEFVSASNDKLKQIDAGSLLTLANGAELNFNQDGRLVEFQSAFDRKVRYAYTEDGQIEKVNLGGDNVLVYSYEDGRVVRIAGPEGLDVEYSYESGRLNEVVNGWRHRITYRYDDAGTLIAATDDYGNVTPVPSVADTNLDEFPADPDAYLAQDEPAESDAEAEIEVQIDRPANLPPRPVKKFDKWGRLTHFEERGRVTEYRYDDDGRLLSETGSEGTTSWTYDKYGRIAAILRPDGSRLKYSYNKHDQPTLIESSAGETLALEYNEHGDLVRKVSSNGETVEYAYDGRGRVESMQPSVGVGEVYRYDRDDNVIAIEYSNGRMVEYVYDADGRRISTSWSTGTYVDNYYNADGRLVETDENGLLTTFGYDEQGRLRSVSDPVHGTKVYDYRDEDEDVVSLVDSAGTRTLRTNAWVEPLETLVSAEGFERRSQTRYDDFGQVSDVTSTSGRYWSYRYDQKGRRVGIDAPGGQTIDLEYDPAGWLTSVVRDGVECRKYVYDRDGRLQMESTPRGIAIVYSWDDSGRIQEVIEPDGKVRYRYDERGLVAGFGSDSYRIEQEHHADGSLARRNYETAGLDLQLPQDEAGRPAGIALNDIEVRYDYDRFSRISAMILPGGVRVSIARDEAGRPTEISYSNTAWMQWQWDERNRLTSIAAAGEQDTAVLIEEYGYDPVGNLVHLQTDDKPAHEMTYDDDDRLTNILADTAVTSFEYDRNDNLVAVGTNDRESRWDLDAGGRPKFLGTRAMYIWDEGGNLSTIEDTNGRSGNAFDAAGRLVHRKFGDYEWEFGYLPDGDRLWKAGPNGAVWYAYTPQGLTAIRDEANTPWLVVNLPGTDIPLALCGPAGATLFVVPDRLGSIRRVLDPSGQVLSRTDYGAYGQIVANDGSAPLAMFAGMVRDNHGLYYARRRYYDPALLRFISIDPWVGSHTNPASHNSYSYAANNPYRFRDPTGVAAEPVNFGAMSDEQLRAFFQNADRALDDAFDAFDVARATEPLVEQPVHRYLNPPRNQRYNPTPARTLPFERERELLAGIDETERPFRDAKRELQRRGLEVPPSLQRSTAGTGRPGSDPTMDVRAGTPGNDGTLDTRQRNSSGTPTNNLTRDTGVDGTSQHVEIDNTRDTGPTTIDNAGPDNTRNTAPDGNQPRPDVNADDPTRANDVGPNDPTIDRDTNRPRRNRVSADDPTIPGNVDPNDPTIDRDTNRPRRNRVNADDPTIPDNVDPNDPTIDRDTNRPRRNRVSADDPTIPGNVDPNDPTIDRDTNRPRRNRVNADDPTIPGNVDPNDATIDRATNRPRQARANAGVADDVLPDANRGAAGRGVNLPDRPVAGGAGSFDDVLRQQSELGSVARRGGVRPLSAATKRRLFARRLGRRMMQLGFAGVGLGLLNLYDNAQTAQAVYEVLSNYARDVQEQNERLEAWERQRLYENAQRQVATRLIDQVLDGRNNPNSVWQLVPSVTLNSDGTVTVNEPNRQNLINQMEQNIYAGRMPLTGIFGRRDGIAPTDFKQALTKAEAEIRKRDEIRKRVYERLNNRDRALAEAEPKLKLAEAGLDGEPKDFESLKEAVAKLREQIEKIRQLREKNGETLADLTEKLQTAADEVCGNVAYATTENRDGQAGKTVEEKRQNLIDANKAYEELDTEHKEFLKKDRELEQLEARLQESMQDVERRLDDLGNLSFLLDDDKQYDDSIQAIRDLLAEADEQWQADEIKELWQQQGEHNRRARRLLEPWLRNPHAQELFDKKPLRIARLPEDDRPTKTHDELREQLGKLEKVLDEIPDDAAEIVKDARNTLDEAEALLRELRNEGNQEPYMEKKHDRVGTPYGRRLMNEANQQSSGAGQMLSLGDNPKDDAKLLLIRLRGCRDLIAQNFRDDGGMPTSPETTETITDAFSALDPTNPFDKGDWTIAAIDEDENKQSSDEIVPEAPANDEQKPTVPIVQQEVFRPQDFNIVGEPTPEEHETKEPREIRPPAKNLIAVPDVRGLPPDKAHAKITSIGLKPSINLGLDAPSLGLQHQVYTQQPAPNVIVAPGTAVRATIYDKPLVEIAEAEETPARPGTKRLPRRPARLHTQYFPPVRQIAMLPATQLVPSARTVPSQPAPGVHSQPTPKNPPEIKPAREIPTRISKDPPSSKSKPTREITPQRNDPVMVQVPDVSGLSAGEASKRIRESGLKPKFISGNNAPSQAKNYRVYAQSPRDGQRVAKNSSIDITVYGQYREQKVTVPDVAGQTFDQASSRLRDIGLKPTQLRGNSAPSKGQESRIYRQSPGAGQKVAKDSSVDITVYGQYREQKVTVPDVAGLTFAQASRHLRNLGLKPTQLRGNSAPSKAQESRIYRQSPRSGQSVKKGSSVDVTVYMAMTTPEPTREPTKSTAKPTREIPSKSNRPKRTVKVPILTRKDYQEAIRILERAGLKAKTTFGTLAYEKNLERKVYYHIPWVGEVVPEGSTVELKVYSDMDSAPGSIEGTWICTCGAKWLFFDRQGAKGRERNRDGGWDREVKGSLNGQVYRFSWTATKPEESGGKSGNGVITFNKSVTKGNWRMTNSDGKSWTGSITKDDGKGGNNGKPANSKQTFNKAGINLTNRTGETLYLDIEYRSDRSGTWKWHSTTSTISNGYSGPLKDKSGQTIAASRIKISARGSSGHRYDDLEKSLVKDGKYTAEKMGMHNLNYERRKK